MVGEGLLLFFFKMPRMRSKEERRRRVRADAATVTAAFLADENEGVLPMIVAETDNLTNTNCCAMGGVFR